jgi:sulfopyruvate decarboxylase TPP-binding subunit
MRPAVLRRAQVRQVAYVPDAGLSELIALTHDDPEMTVSVLTTEEEGIGVLAGAWLGGQRGALLMQSSGVGNCLNMLALVKTCRFPLLAIVTMRGEWAEFNPWQVPMGQATGPAQHRVIQTPDVEAHGEIGRASCRERV